MNQKIKYSLAKKGWTDKEISKTANTFNKLNSNADIHKTTYWISLLIMLICNLAVSVFLIPVILVFSGVFLYFIIVIIALMFGFMFNSLIQSLEHLEAKHHVAALFFIPLTGILNIFIIVTVAKNFALLINTTLEVNTLLLSVVYVVLFLIPYVLSLRNGMAAEI